VIDVEVGNAAWGLFRVYSASLRGVPTGASDVVESMGDSPEATRAIWQYLLDIAWTSRIKALFLPLDHPLFLLLAEPRRLRFTVPDGLGVRLVDVGAALSAGSHDPREAVGIEGAELCGPCNHAR